MNIVTDIRRFVRRHAPVLYPYVGGFCPKPFEHFEVHVSGDVYSCCPSWVKKPIGNLLEADAKEIWNSKAAVEFRETILDGSYALCKKDVCPNLQPYGYLPLIVQVKNPATKRFLRKKEAVLRHSFPKTYVPAYDLTCNLKCESCRTKDYAFTGDALHKAEAVQENILNSNILKDVGSMIISGQGEPLASRLYDRFLKDKQIIENNKLKITLLTNGQLLNEKKWEELKSIHHAVSEIWVSIDAAEESTYVKNRYPGNFEKLRNNLLLISKLRKSGRINIFRTNFVVQANNYREMRSFVYWCKELKADAVAFSMLLNIGTYNDADYRERAVHDPLHPEHKEFLDVLSDPVFREKGVFLGNLEHLIS